MVACDIHPPLLAEPIPYTGQLIHSYTQSYKEYAVAHFMVLNLPVWSVSNRPDFIHDNTIAPDVTGWRILLKIESLFVVKDKQAHVVNQYHL